MPESDKPVGTMGHVKGMASAVYTQTSEQGNQYPRLVLTVDYRDPKNLRLRAYAPKEGQAPDLSSFRLVDTLGANDLSEAVLLAGFTVRYAETMHARPLRKKLGLE